jgi:hypothetical protein
MNNKAKIDDFHNSSRSSLLTKIVNPSKTIPATSNSAGKASPSQSTCT